MGEFNVEIHTFLTSALIECEWSNTRLCRFAYSIRSCVGPRAGLDDVEKRNFLNLLRFELWPLDHPGRRQSLYRLRYPGNMRIQDDLNKSVLSLFSLTHLSCWQSAPFIVSCASLIQTTPDFSTVNCNIINRPNSPNGFWHFREIKQFCMQRVFSRPPSRPISCK
jgi:hypothetical protein